MKHEVLTKLIESFREHKDLDVGPHREDYFTGGHCAEFAIALSTVLWSFEIDSEVEVIIRKELDDDTNEEFCRTISHVVVVVDGKRYDITGNESAEQWEESFEVYTDEGLLNEWESVKIPSTGIVTTRDALLEIIDGYGCKTDLVDTVFFYSLLIKIISEQMSGKL